MKKNKLFMLVAMFATLVLFLSACNGDGGASQEPQAPADSTSPYAEFGLDENMRFYNQRTISVSIWDRGHDRMPILAESYWADWIAAEILAAHNIVIEWETVPRWNEQDFYSTALPAQTAPDVGYTFSTSLVDSFAEMGGIHDLTPLLARYGALLPNMYNLLGEDLVYWNLNPVTDELWSITGRLFQDGRVLTFIREDWLDILDLPIPTTLAEFEETLLAFRDNAADLVANSSDIIPFFVTDDVGWDASLIFESFIPSDVTDREWFVYGFSDRRFFHEDAIRQGTQVLNRWFNEDLMWNDFVIAEPSVVHDHIRAGNVGSFIANWDMPFRAGDGWITGMRENVGDDANFIPIAPFVNDAGEPRKIMPNPTDRFIFFPATNDEVLASLLYLDFMSRPEVLDVLQFGIEGVHHYVAPDGAIIALAEDEENDPWPDNQMVPSVRNFDLALMLNGVHFFASDIARAEATLAAGYPGIEPAAVLAARNLGLSNAYWFRNVQHRVIVAQEGMSTPLREEMDVCLHQLIAATSPADFEASFNACYQDWLDLGARAIIAEREAAWIEAFGDVDTRP